MTQSLTLGSATNSTGSGSSAGSLAHGMTQSGGLVSGVGVAAGAGVGGITSLGTSGGGHNGVVVVAVRSNLLGVGIAASGTGMGDGTLIGTSGIHSHTLIAVAQSAAGGSATDRAGLGVGAGSIHPDMTQSSNLIGYDSAAANAVSSGIAVLGAGGVGDHNIGGIAGVPAVMSGAVQELGASLGTIGLQIGAVTVLQPDGVNIHCGIAGAAAVQAINIVLNAGAIVHNDLTGLLGGDDGCATADRVHILIHRHGAIKVAVADDGAVNINDNILQVAGSALIATGGRRVGCGHQFQVCENEITPVIQIVNINIMSAGAVESQVVHFASRGILRDVQRSRLVDINLNTGHQCHILLQRNSAGICVDGNIAVQGQNIVTGVEFGGTNHRIQNSFVAGVGHIDDDALNGGITVQIHHQAVGGGIVILHHIAVLRLEHTVGTNEFHRGCGNVEAGNGHGCKDIFRGAGINGQSHFNILNIVLGNEEGPDVIVGGIAVAVVIRALFGVYKAGQVGAAGEVSDLHHFVHLSAGVGGDGAVAVDITPDIQIGTVVDGDVCIGAHVNGAVRAADTTAVGTGSGGTLEGGQLCLALNGAVDRQVDTVSQSQGPVGGGGSIAGGDRWVRSHGGISIISGHQQGHAGRDGIIAGRDSTICHQGDDTRAVGGGIFDGLSQTGNIVTAHIEHRGGAGHNDGLDGVRRVKCGSKGRSVGDILTGGHIVPANKSGTFAGGGSEGVGCGRSILQIHRVGAGAYRNTLGAVGHGVAAVGGSLQGSGNAGYTGLNQADIRHCDVHGVGSTAGSICVHKNGNGSASGQFLGVFDIGNSSGMLGTIDGDIATGEVARNGILEGQCGCDTLFIGNG